MDTVKRASVAYLAILMPICLINAKSASSEMPGAIVEVSASGEVGFLLDEIPHPARSMIVERIEKYPEPVWQERARRIISLTNYRLNYRRWYDCRNFDNCEQMGAGIRQYHSQGAKALVKQLPLPPRKLWNIEALGDLKRVCVTEDSRTKIISEAEARSCNQDKKGHDLLLRSFNFISYLVTDIDSPTQSEPNLQKVGDTWQERFILPLDPDFLFQRTGYACLDRADYPAEQVFAETAHHIFDEQCVGSDDATDFTDLWCHCQKTSTKQVACYQNSVPKLSCPSAIRTVIGAQDIVVNFEWVAWHEGLAENYTVGTPTANGSPPDLVVEKDALQNNWVDYRFIPKASCVLKGRERCVGKPGWRKLLMFDGLASNVGGSDLVIGRIVKVEDGKLNPDNFHVKSNQFELSQCHDHYHFHYYGSYALGGENNSSRKQGFCLIDTDRLHNNMETKTWSLFDDCLDQGISRGWGDNYEAGLDCQWVDVTDYHGLRASLNFTVNPDNVLCEGRIEHSADNMVLSEATEFNTEHGGLPVYKHVCKDANDNAQNNAATITVELNRPDDPNVPNHLESMSYVLNECASGVIGPKKNCGFRLTSNLLMCEPGKNTTIKCILDKPDRKEQDKSFESNKLQIVRLCGYSHELNSAIPCSHNDSILTQVMIGPVSELEAQCPMGSNEVPSEIGGRISVLASAIMDGLEYDPVACWIKSQ